MINEIIENIKKSIAKENVSDDDIEGYIYNCILYDIDAACDFYKCTEKQLNIATNRIIK